MNREYFRAFSSSAGDAFFPGATFDSVGTVYAGMLHTTPTIGSTPAERFLALTIAGAERRVVRRALGRAEEPRRAPDDATVVGEGGGPPQPVHSKVAAAAAQQREGLIAS